jgi:hypothetical protein
MNNKYKELYNYLLDNKMTSLDENSFYNEYSQNDNKFSELYSYLQTNKMTSLDPETFKLEYFGTPIIKKKSQVESTESDLEDGSLERLSTTTTRQLEPSIYILPSNPGALYRKKGDSWLKKIGENYIPLSKGDVRARERILDKQAVLASDFQSDWYSNQPKEIPESQYVTQEQVNKAYPDLPKESWKGATVTPIDQTIPTEKTRAFEQEEAKDSILPETKIEPATFEGKLYMLEEGKDNENFYKNPVTEETYLYWLDNNGKPKERLDPIKSQEAVDMAANIIGESQMKQLSKINKIDKIDLNKRDVDKFLKKELYGSNFGFNQEGNELTINSYFPGMNGDNEGLENSITIDLSKSNSSSIAKEFLRYNLFTKREKESLENIKDTESYIDAMINSNGKIKMTSDRVDVISEWARTESMAIENDIKRNEVDVIDKDIKSYEEKTKLFKKRVASGNMTQQEFDKENDDLSKLYKDISIKQKRAQELSNRAQKLISAEELIQKKVTPEEKGSTLGALVKSFTSGMSNLALTGLDYSLAAGNLIMGDEKFSKLIDGNYGEKKAKGLTDAQIANAAQATVKDFAKEKYDLGWENITETNKEYIRSENRGMIPQALNAVAESFGTAATGGALGKVGSTAAFFSMSYNAMEDQMRGPDFDHLNENEKKLISVPYGLVIGQMEKWGFDVAVGAGKNPLFNKFANYIVTKTFKNLPKNAGLIELNSAIQKNIGASIAKGLIKITGAGVSEGNVEFMQQEFEGIQKFAVNEILKNDNFNEEYFKDAPDLSKAGGWSTLLDQGVDAFKLGFLAGGMTSTGASVKDNITDISSNNKFDIYKSFVLNTESRNGWIASIKEDEKNGKISPEEMNKKIDELNKSYSVLTKIPASLTTQSQREAFSLLQEREIIQNEIKDKDPNLVVKETNRIKEINESLKTTSENATKEDNIKQQEGTAEGGISEYQGTGEGQQEVGVSQGGQRETTINEADSSDSTIPSKVQQEVATEVVIDKPIITTNTTAEVQRVKSLTPESEDGATFNIDGTKYEGVGLVVPVDSMNTTTEELTSEMVADFVAERQKMIGDAGVVKAGIYKFPNSNQVSIDLSVVVPETSREQALEFARLAGQESLFDLETFENIKTGATGENPMKFTPEQHREISKALKEGRMPNVFGTTAETTKNLLTKENVNEVTSKQTTPKNKLIVKAAKMVLNAIPGVKIYIHNNGQEMASAIEASKKQLTKEEKTGLTESSGLYVDGDIHINLESATIGTVYHEAFHALIEKNGMKSGSILLMAKGLKNIISDKGVKQRLDDFVSQYNEDEKAEEYISELGGILSEAEQELTTTKLQQFKTLINNIAKKLGLPVIFSASATAQDAADFINTMSKKLRTGEEIKDLSAEGKDGKIKRQVEKLFLGETPKFKSLDDVSKYIQSWVNENKLFDKSIEEVSDQVVIDKFSEHVLNEIRAWESIKGSEYVGFYNEDIPQRLNPELQKFAKQRYGRELTGEEVSLYHMVSAFASPSADPHFDSSKGLEVFDKYMMTGNLSAYGTEQATIWDTDSKGKRYDTGKLKFDDKGNPVYKQVAKAYATTSLEKFNNIVNNFNGDVSKAVNWVLSNHSFDDASKMMGKPTTGAKANQLDENEYFTKENGGTGVFAITGAKLGSYILNRIGNYSTVTKDMWYARTLARLAGESLTEKGKAIKSPWASNTKQGLRKRKLADKAFEIVAKELGTSPADVQQKIWDFEKRLYEKLGAVEKTSYASEGLKSKAKQILSQQSSKIKFQKNKTDKLTQNWVATPVKSMKDSPIAKNSDNLRSVAIDLAKGKINQGEYADAVKKYSPIGSIGTLFAPSTLSHMIKALGKKAGKLMAPVVDELGKKIKRVGLRLDIPSYLHNNAWIVTVHDGRVKNGNVISYRNAARLKNVDFTTDPRVALNIAAGFNSKGTFARMEGEMVDIPGETAEEQGLNAQAMVEEIMNDPSWVQVGMNPFRHSFFWNRANGAPVVSADEVIQVGGLVYAKNVIEASPNSDRFTVYGKYDETTNKVVKSDEPLLDKSGSKIKFQKTTTKQEAIQKAKDKYELSVEKRGNSHQQGVTASLGDLQKSDWYVNADDTAREDAVREIKAFFGEKLKKAPSVAKIMGTPKSSTVTVTEKTALKDQIKLEARAAREAKGDLNQKRKMLAATIKGLVKLGRLTVKQAATIINRVSVVNLDNQVMVNRLADYAARVFEKADYQERLSRAFSFRKGIRKLLKGDIQAEVVGMAKKFSKIDPSMVDDIEKYLEMAEIVKNAIKPSRVNRKDLDVNMRESMNIDSVSEFTNDAIENQEAILKEELLAVHSELVDAGVIDDKMSLSDIESIINSLKEEADGADYEADILTFLSRRIDTMSAIIKDILTYKINPMTGEDVALTEKNIDLISRMLNIDINNVSIKEAIFIAEAMDNFINNNITSSVEAVIEKHEGAAELENLIADKVVSSPLRKYFSNKAGQYMSEQIASMPILFEKLFVGAKKGLMVAKKMGWTALINGVNKAEKMFNTTVDVYFKQYKNTKPNGKSFNDAENVYERGMLAFLSRNVSGTVAQQAEELKRRVEVLKESVKNLLEGSTKEQKMGEIYQKIYDKLNVESGDIDIISANVDKINRSAVDWWINQWGTTYNDLSDISLSVYNTMLSSDTSYSTDRYKLLDKANLEEIIEPKNIGAFGRDIEFLDKNKTGVLMESNRPSASKVSKANRYISLDFDVNNSSAYKAALIDVNTAAAIRRIDGFINSKNFNKLIPTKEDRDIFRRRISEYIQAAKNKRVGPSDTMHYLDQLTNFLGGIGVGKALGGIDQVVKQTLPIALSTFTNSGRLDILTPASNAWIDSLGMAISNRGQESQSTIESIDRRLDKANSGAKVVSNFIVDAQQIWLKWCLSKPDVFIAKSSFISYYKQYLSNNNQSTDIDWATHNVNQDAADYAMLMVDRQQNVSDAKMAGKVFNSQNSTTKIMRKLFLPFASFTLNQKSRMVSDIKVLGINSGASKQDRAIAFRSLASLPLEMALYQSIGLAIRLGYLAIAKGIIGAVVDDDDEEKEKILGMEISKEMKNATKYPLRSMVTDFLSPIPIADNTVVGGANYLLSQLSVDQDMIDEAVSKKNLMLEVSGKEKMNDKEKQNFIEKYKQDREYQLFNDEKKSYGTIGIGYDTYKELMGNINTAYTGKYTQDYMGNESERFLLPKDQDNIKNAVIFETLFALGILPRDVNTISKNIIKLSKKNSLTETQYEKYKAVGKETGGKVTGWKMDLVKSKSKTESTLEELEWIKEYGGLTEKQGQEYVKLSKVIGKISYMKLIDLQSGKTADQIIKYYSKK